MTNPFEAFNISDDEEEAFTPVAEQKVKRTHQEKKNYKLQQEAAKANQVAVTNEPIVTEPLPGRIKQDAKQIRSKRAPPTPATKKLGEGHYHDRRSGTGRVDKPRKEGGGWGNIGNIKDQLNKDKYIKQGEDTKNESQKVIEGEKQKAAEQAPVEQKPEEPAALTLQEYYKSKGVEINNTYEKKTVAKKTEVNADWIKKEKLTVLQSKEDQKLQERNAQNIVKFTSSKVGLSQNLEGLGLFEQKAPKKPEERREPKQEYKGKGKGKKDKVVIQEQDFPTLSAK